MLKKKLISLTAAFLAAVQLYTQTGVSVFASSLDNNYHVQSSDVNETVSRKCSGASEVQTLEYTLEDVEFDNSEAESLYLQELMYEDTCIQQVKRYNAARTKSSLTTAQKQIYDVLLPELKKISSGSRTNAKFAISTSTEYSDISSFGTDVRAAVTSLFRDYPEYLYWSASSWGISFSSGSGTNYVNMNISKAYASSSDSKTFDAAKIQRAQNAITNAKNFAKSCEDLSAYNKVYSFCDKICELNVYNSDAAKNCSSAYVANDCNPWELISVFDNDPNTNVVCEGYSKEMQYLCDLSGIECYIATSDNHMWNIIVLDGTSYHVDVTFADTSTADNLSIVKQYHPYVLKGASYSDGNKVSVGMNVPGYSSTPSVYVYEDQTLDMIPLSIRKVSTTDYKPCDTISNLKATTTSNTAKLTWNKYSDADYYKVYVEQNGKWVQQYKTSNNSTVAYTATGLTPNTSYKFRIVGYKGTTAVAYSDVTAKTSYAKIANLKATSTSNTAKLTWSKYSGADFYKVYVAKDGKWVQQYKTSNNSTVAYTATGLTPNTSYKFRVVGYKGTTAVAYSDVTAKTAFDKITNLKATTTSNTAKLIWSKYSGADFYKVYVAKDGKWVQLYKTSSNSTVAYTATGLTPNTSYKFRIVGYKGTTAVAYSDVTAKTSYAKIANLKATSTSNTAKLTWSKYSGADFYKVYVAKDGKWVQLYKTSSNSTVAYNATGLSPNTSYKFRVVGYKGTTAVAYSDVTAKTAFASITNLKATSTSNTAKLTWSKYSGADSYKVYVAKDGKWVQLYETSNNSTVAYTATKLTANTTYKFRVVGCKGTKAVAYADITVKTK